MRCVVCPTVDLNVYAPLGTQVTEALTHGTISWKGKGERRTLLYKYAQSHVGYGNAPTVPANYSGVTLTEEQRRLFVGEQLSNAVALCLHTRTAPSVCAVFT